MECLVLDTSFAPVATVKWEKAITMFFKNLVEVVEEHPNRVIRSATLEIKMPIIVRLLTTKRSKNKAVKFSREAIWARDQGHCQYCGRAVTRADMTYDHVIPKDQGGKTTWDNIATCCGPCNQKKGGRTPQQAGMTLRKQPVRPAKLSNVRFCLTYKPGMPLEWAQWMQIDIPYWHGTLDEDK